MNNILEYSKKLYGLEGFELKAVSGHDGGRNNVFVCSKNGESKYVLRVSSLEDRSEEEYLAELEFVRFLAENGAPVANVRLSVNSRLLESLAEGDNKIYLSLFDYAKGMLISDNGYRYREGAPLSEYFVNTGKSLGKIHRLSKIYAPEHKRNMYFDKYNMEYIDSLISNKYLELKRAISRRLDEFKALPVKDETFGLVHFDFSDGNYHIDMTNGDITVFDFDNSMYCFYMFDLANLWTHAVGWYRGEKEAKKRKAGMEYYFEKVLEGYRSETEVSDEFLSKLPLFIDMVLIENIVDEFECCKREGEELDFEDIEDAAMCLINDIQYAGFFEEQDE